MKNILLIFIFLSSCTSYDKLLIYDKTHNIIDSKLMRYDGFYYCNIDEKIRDKNCNKKVLPIFFYLDGTAYTSGKFCNLDSLKSFYIHTKTHPNFNWGSYTVEGHEITVEFYWPNSGSLTYERYHMKGYIDRDSIIFSSYINRHIVSKSINYKYYFEPFDIKPDSSLSFIKTNKRFN